MGGATSKLEETDWGRADGRLGDVTDTVDGRPPTSQYQTYELVKRGYNQREFDVVDAQKELLYSTRMVPSTIACFDVLGNRLDEPELRINVDLSRRYWVVYRFGKPAFEGQLHDEEASEKVCTEYREQGTAGEPPRLYRAALVTVSWSRFVSVAAHYGAPTPQMVIDYQASLEREIQTQTDTDKSDNANVDSDAHPINEKPHGYNADIDCKLPFDNESITKQQNEGDLDNPDKEVHVSLSMPEINKNNSQDMGTSVELVHSSSAPSFDQNQTAEAIVQTGIAEWVALKTLHLQETTKQILSSNPRPSHKREDPMEGVISFDKPLLLCQEIYTRIRGNHQTSLLSKEQALELFRQEDEVYDREHVGPDDVSDPQGPEALSSQSYPLRTDDEPLDEPKQPGPDNYSQNLFEFANEKKEDMEDAAVAESSDQPLIGYWLWENTLRTHKMKLHLAKGSDLALHVVLAVIVNQVRLERNAVALAL